MVMNGDRLRRWVWRPHVPLRCVLTKYRVLCGCGGSAWCDQGALDDIYHHVRRGQRFFWVHNLRPALACVEDRAFIRALSIRFLHITQHAARCCPPQLVAPWKRMHGAELNHASWTDRDLICICSRNRWLVSLTAHRGEAPPQRFYACCSPCRGATRMSLHAIEENSK